MAYHLTTFLVPQVVRVPQFENPWHIEFWWENLKERDIYARFLESGDICQVAIELLQLSIR